MPLVSRNCIENIKERVNIQDVVAQYVSLKRSGSSWKGLSPFSNEKSPSFFVLPDKNIFKCFSSGYAGDIFRFLQLKENLSFQEAIESIAHRFNITLEYETDSGSSQQSTSLKKELFEIHEAAANIFHQYFLSNTNDGKFIQDYWKNDRNFTLEVAKEFTIGLAPIESHTLIQLFLKQKRFSPEALRASGLFFAKENESDLKRFISRFRGRLMIPIRDIQGRIIAFAGRQLKITPQDDPAKDAKYINSPETPIFHKGKVLFGLDRARQSIDKEGYFILVEGQLDAIRCWENGLKTAVAPQGTGITEQQLGTLRRYSSKVYSLFDSDGAGQKASLRILPMALKEGIDISFVSLPKGSDPDEYLTKEGPISLKKEFKNAQSPMKFIVNSFLPPGLIPSPQEKIHVLKEIFEIITKCDSLVMQEEHLLEVCQLLSVNRQSIQEDFQHYKISQKALRRTNLIQNTQIKTKEKLTTVEYQLLLIILNHENLILSLTKQINPGWITGDSIEAKLLLRILNEIREDLWLGISGIDSVLETDEERNFIYSMLSEDLIFEDPLKTANICLKKLFTNYLDEKRRTVDERIANASNEESIIRQLQQERINLRRLSQNPPSIEMTLQTY